MAKYTVIKDITLQQQNRIKNGYVVPLKNRTISFKIGDIVNGELGGNPENDTGYLQVTTLEGGTVNFTTSRNSVIRPYIETENTTNTSTNTTATPTDNVDAQKPIPNSFVWTPMKKGIVVVLVIATAFYLLKVNKVI